MSIPLIVTGTFLRSDFRGLGSIQSNVKKQGLEPTDQMKVQAITLIAILMLGVMPVFAMTDQQYNALTEKGIYPVELINLERGTRPISSPILSSLTIEEGNSVLFYSGEDSGRRIHQVISVDMIKDEQKNSIVFIPNQFFDSGLIKDDGKSQSTVKFEKQGTYYFKISCQETHDKTAGKSFAYYCSQIVERQVFEITVKPQKTQAQKLAQIEAEKPQQCKYEMDSAGNCLAKGEVKKPYLGKTVKQMIVQKEVENSVVLENAQLKQKIADQDNQIRLLNAKIDSMTKMINMLKAKITTLLG